MAPKGTLRTCPQGHRYLKSSDCPSCPICERTVALAGFPKVGAPARRALENAGIRSLEQLAQRTEAGLLQLHGIGPSTLPLLRAALNAAGLSFKHSSEHEPKRSVLGKTLRRR